MIRRAKLFDAGEVVKLCEKFYPHTSYSHRYAFDYETVHELTVKLIQHGIVFVVELDKKLVGVMGVSVHPFLFNKNKLTCGEVVWWIDPEAQDQGWGKQLLVAVDKECKEWGLEAGQLFLMSNSPPHAQALYESLGYQLTELAFTKEFN
jgi:ribosomal protein S18 acetylase RimI-like enzyme